MQHRTPSCSLHTLAGLLLLGGLWSTGAAQQLELGRLTKGSTADEHVATFAFRSASAGILTVAVRSASESDLVLVVTDMDGQPLPNGRSDQDVGGDTGAEQFAVTIPRADDYQVRVETFGSGDATFQIGASWLGFPSLETPADPNGSPRSATRLPMEQQTLDEALDGAAGDYWDWFALSTSRSGTLTVATRAEDGDLVLEAFREGAYAEPMERSDQDLQESGGNEALTLSVRAGETLYFKVSAFGGATTVAYRLQVGFIPD